MIALLFYLQFSLCRHHFLHVFYTFSTQFLHVFYAAYARFLHSFYTFRRYTFVDTFIRYTLARAFTYEDFFNFGLEILNISRLCGVAFRFETSPQEYVSSKILANPEQTGFETLCLALNKQEKRLKREKNALNKKEKYLNEKKRHSFSTMESSEPYAGEN